MKILIDIQYRGRKLNAWKSSLLMLCQDKANFHLADSFMKSISLDYVHVNLHMALEEHFLFTHTQRHLTGLVGHETVKM